MKVVNGSALSIFQYSVLALEDLRGTGVRNSNPIVNTGSHTLNWKMWEVLPKNAIHVCSFDIILCAQKGAGWDFAKS